MKYREIEEKDIKKLCIIVCDSFELDCYFEEGFFRACLYRNYLCGYIAGSNFSIVVEDDNGRVIGVLLAKIPGLKEKDRRRYIKIIKRAGFFLYFRANGKTYYKNMRLIDGINGRLKKKITVKPELKIIAVEEKSRRKGIAKEMMSRFTAELIINGFDEYFLYTDSYCDVDYYRNNGYTEVASEGIMFGDKKDSRFYIFKKSVKDVN